MLDVNKIKKDFPIFKFHPQLVYLDSAAMSLKPKMVMKAMDDYYSCYSANVFRGIYQLSEKATEEYELARKKVGQFINATTDKEIIFVRNTTEAINLIAYAWGRLNMSKGDEIVTTIMEHHSNFIPWQMLAGELGAKLKIIDITDDGYLDLGLWNDEFRILDIKEKRKKIKFTFEGIITKRTKILSLTYVSNVLGTINPVKEIITTAKKINPKIIIIIDAAQAVPHLKVDVQDLNCDFLAFSGQKILGPTGIGVLWAKIDHLEKMSPFLVGGETIREVYLEKTIFTDSPHKFEAGTPNIAGVIGLGAAINYLNKIGIDKIRNHEKALTRYALSRLREVKDLIVYGPKEVIDRAGVFTFNLTGIHPHDVAAILDEVKICVRSGHHCAMPLHTRLGLNASVRATFYLYNTKEDVDRLIDGLLKVKKIFK